MWSRLFEDNEGRLVGLLFWAAVFVPMLIGAVVIAQRTQVVEDMLGGTGAPEEGSDGDWMSIGKSLTSWTPGPPAVTAPTPPDATADAKGDPGGGGSPPATTSSASGDPGKMASKGAIRPTSGNSTGDGTGSGTGDGTGSGTGPGTGSNVKTRPEGAGGVVGAKKPCLPPRDEIRKIDDNDYSIDRSILDYYAKHPKEVGDLAYLLPSFDAEGKPDGFHVTGMRCGNPLQQGGLKNGDVVHTVNGKRLNTVVQAIATYAKIHNEEHLQLIITRKGVDMKLDYDIIE